MKRFCGIYIFSPILLALLSGCMVGPDYKQPVFDVPETYSSETLERIEQEQTADQDLVHWWERFNDPVLTSLIHRAIEGNFDLQIAETRIRQARAMKGQASAPLGPSLDASGLFKKSSYPTDSQSSAPDGGEAPSGSSQPDASGEDTSTTDQYQTGFDATWEIDFFGGLRRNVEAAEAAIESSVQSYRDQKIRLIAEIARSYIRLRTEQRRITIARQSLKTQKDSATLIMERFDNGLVGALDVAGAEAEVAKTAAGIPHIEVSARTLINSLAVLLGLMPNELLAELSEGSNIPVVSDRIDAGVPSELLRRRPDIRKAEANIREETARVGVAVSDLYPKFSILGSAGYLSSGTLSSGQFWSFGPSINWNVLSSGSIRSRIKAQKLSQHQSVLEYKKIVLIALQEVEDSIFSYGKEMEHRDALSDMVKANRKAVSLANDLYVNGETNYINLLLAQRSLHISEDFLAQSNGRLAVQVTALYKALGGGWYPSQPQPKRD